jgi:5-methylcytosine-specific restriction endonuclease McrA
MNPYELSGLSDQVLVRDLKSHLAHERGSTAVVLAHIAEVDARQLYVPAGYPSMYLYCVEHLHMSEDEAFRRIRAARTAREFPAVFAAVAVGRLHLSAVVMLTPCLTAENAEELLAAATHKTKAQIEHLLAQRFPRPDVPTLIEALAAPMSPTISGNQLVPEPVGCQNSIAQSETPVSLPAPPAKVAPLSPGRYAIHCSVAEGTHALLREALDLLGRSTRDVPEVLDGALALYVRHLRRRKFAATEKPRSGRGSRRTRHIPAEVKRAVWERDQGRCTFVSESGQRCPATSHLQFDHLDPVARGGRASVDRMRLLCRAHNQYAAERTFGSQFMIDKRRGAQRAATEQKAAAERAAAETRATRQAQAMPAASTVQSPAATKPDPDRDVTPWLRALGFNAAEARRAAVACEGIPDASLEERVRFGLKLLQPPHRRVGVAT